MAARKPSQRYNQLLDRDVNIVLESVLEYPLPQVLRNIFEDLWDNVKHYLSELKSIDPERFYFKLNDVSFSSFILISLAGFVLVILMIWLIIRRCKGKDKATDPEKDELIVQNQRLKALTVDLEKQVTEHREKRLIAERKITELKTNKDNKGKIEHEEMLRQLKSAFKEEVATLKCEKQEVEDREKRLISELNEHETDMDNKRKIENEELKSAIQVKEEIATLKCEIDKVKAQRNLYWGFLHFRLYNELRMKGRHPNCLYNLHEYDRRLLMMHPVVLMTRFNMFPPGSTNSSHSEDSSVAT
ncbi:hypothetical protein OS493_020809 [Desmophyllum pertusum]|uniref:Uncharacterized protein n=1 Tax=Desmophyllum pertusum TaxID=174260 RepID=A0A9X0CEE1_9CNID|nr:hypothetical protein OS493_020809 [Desmophyllum pertusum]